MKRIEIPRWTFGLVITTLFALFVAYAIVALRGASLNLDRYEADSIEYLNRKLSGSVDEKVLAWKKFEKWDGREGCVVKKDSIWKD